MSSGLGGMTAWLAQRISAVYLALFLVFFLLALLFTGSWNYAEWRALMAQPAMITATLLFHISLLLHAWVGVRDVIIDYVHPLPWRLAVLAAVGAALLALAFWGMLILVGLWYS